MKYETKSKFLDLFEKSVILQAILTISIVGACLYLFVTGQDVPPTLIQWAGFMMGLYGAGKVNAFMTRGQ